MYEYEKKLNSIPTPEKREKCIKSSLVFTKYSTGMVYAIVLYVRSSVCPPVCVFSP